MHKITLDQVGQIAHDNIIEIFLKEILYLLKQEFNCIPTVGVEIEFYHPENILIDQLSRKFNIDIVKEKGKNQFEIILNPTNNIILYARYIQQLRLDIIQYAIQQSVSINFDSKPFLDDYGNAMHVHLSLSNADQYDHYAIILCNYIQKSLSCFIEGKLDYQRLQDTRFMSPTTVSYGSNNRTVAIRMIHNYPKRLEHRVPSANANPFKVFYAILYALYHGLKYPDHIVHLPKIFGNAFDDQYNLVKIIEKL